MIIGAHISASGGPHKSVPRALNDECECMQIFTKNNNRWAQRMWTEKEAQMFREAYAASPLQGVVSHAAYLINLCSANPAVVDKSKLAIVDELDRCQLLGIPYLVLHPGSPGDQGEEWGVEQIANNINEVYSADPERWPDVTLLYENMAGQGAQLGRRFEHLHELLKRMTFPERFGVCFDTCHAHAAGYDITTEQGYQEVIDTFDDIVGLEHLKVFHLNDSKKPLGARVDRHEDIGQGTIGLPLFEWLINDPRFENHLGVLETPYAEGDFPNLENVRRIKSLRHENP